MNEDKEQIEREINYNLELINYHADELEKLRLRNNHLREKLRKINPSTHG